MRTSSRSAVGDAQARRGRGRGRRGGRQTGAATECYVRSGRTCRPLAGFARIVCDSYKTDYYNDSLCDAVEELS